MRLLYWPESTSRLLCSVRSMQSCRQRGQMVHGTVPIQNIWTIMDRRTDGRTGQRTRMSSRRRRIRDTYEETFTKKHLRRDTYEETLTKRHCGVHRTGRFLVGGDNVTARAPVPSATCGVIPFTRAPPNKGNNKGDFVDPLCQKQRERSGAIVEARSAQRYMVLCSMFSRW